MLFLKIYYSVAASEKSDHEYDIDLSWDMISADVGLSFSKEEFMQCDFDYFVLNDSVQYATLIIFMFEEFNLFSTFRLTPVRLLTFIELVEENYYENPCMLFFFET